MHFLEGRAAKVLGVSAHDGGLCLQSKYEQAQSQASY